jgi:hypothetical protein
MNTRSTIRSLVPPNRRGKPIRRESSRKPARPRLMLESLEGRDCPAFIVTTAADAGLGSLRQAILDANANPGPDDIRFNISGTGLHTIALGSALPPLIDTAGVTIDGYTQLGSSRNMLAVGDNAQLKIVLDGRAAGDADGLVIFGGNSRVEGLVIDNFRGRLTSEGYVGGVGIRLAKQGNNIIAGNFIGTTATGTVAAGNSSFGIYVQSDSPNNTIGGPAPGTRNLISGNDRDGILLSSPGNVIAGNYVGVNRTGNAALANGEAGVAVRNDGNTIGGTTPGSGNVLSGNLRFGLDVLISSAIPSPLQTRIQGNTVGLGANGSTPVGNGSAGVNLSYYSRNVLVGGTEPGARNVISGNAAEGVKVQDGATTVTLQGNYIGTDVTGMLARGNASTGVLARNTSGVVIGGSVAGAGNLISGNRTGIVDNGSDDVIQGNLVGANRLGVAALPNTIGVMLDHAVNTTVGGTDPLARNVISGNRQDGILLDSAATHDNMILGNYVGTDITGTRDLGNGRDGIHLQRGPYKNVIGGTADGARNLISGNNGSGVALADGSPDNFVAGNYIGTNGAGDAALGNSVSGVSIVDSNGNMIGGITPGAGNVISGQHDVPYTGVRDRWGVLLFGSAAGNTVAGNFIGANAAGTAALPNTDGVEVRTAIGAGNTIGGSDPGAGNLISGNARYGIATVGGSDLVVQGNVIGLNAATTAALGNKTAGILLNGALSDLIGGSDPGAGNVISGNAGAGLWVRFGDSSTVMGNRIGTDPAGTHAIPNAGGVLLAGTTNALVGGSSASARNVISGNTGYGIHIGRETLGGRAATNNFVAGNYIGTDASGSTALGNSAAGVVLTNQAQGNLIGNGNVISANRVGILVSGVGTLTNTISGNYIGTDASGSAPLGNLEAGVRIAGGATNTLVGGYTDADRNVISGNPIFNLEIVGATTNFNTVAGNYVGLNAAGNAKVFATSGRGISIEGPTAGTLIGGTAPGARNVVSGNSSGVLFGAGARNVVVEGNYIGTDATGMFAVGNNNGVYGNNRASEIRVGGDTPAARNLISGNNEGVTLNNYGGYVHNVKIQGNWFGLDAAGAGVVDNGIGITVSGHVEAVSTQDVSHVVIDSNTIANSVDTAIAFRGPFARNNLVVGNTIQRSGRSGVLILKGANNNVIGGTTAAARNIISGNTVFGIEINTPISDVPFVATTKNTILGNFIGTDGTGTEADPNGIGINVRGGTNNLIGGTVKGSANVISGNVYSGVVILERTSKGNVLQGNFIGTMAGGGGPLGNGLDGVEITVDASANVVGARVGEAIAGQGNVIAFNGRTGVSVGATGPGLGLASVGNTIRGNSIYDNTLLGIDLGNDSVSFNDTLDPDLGPNRLQNFPQMLSALSDGTRIKFNGTLQGPPNVKFVIDVYATATPDDPTNYGEGKVYLGSVVVLTNGTGLANFDLVTLQLVPVGWAISATATRLSTGDTSEFSKIILLA